MAEVIDFEAIEAQKENIQALPSGRSAKSLAKLAPVLSGSKSINDSIRAEYEAEIACLSDSDDPLDVFDRYVRWTLDAYPSAQATPQSQLHTLLERATKAFVGTPQYKNDLRYLHLWLHYIRLFSDAPRETFVFLSRHGIGETLALFYEEYAAWLESAGRWAQADEVYKLGIEREARPQQRLVRKFGEFEQRRAAQQTGEDDATPPSPALPTMRPALAAKVNPFEAAAPRDPQAPRPNNGVGGQAPKSSRSKLTIFSDASADSGAAPAMPAAGAGSKGWESIGSLVDRKKENIVEPKPWVGETLKAGGRKAGSNKLAVFKDPSLSQQLSKSHIAIHHSQLQVTVNQKGKTERVHVDLRTVYPSPDEPGTELGFEEIWAANRGWLGRSWEDEELPQRTPSGDENRTSEVDGLAENVSQKLVVFHDTVRLDENGAPILPRQGKTKKKKVVEVNETQIIKAKLDSPAGPKIRKKNSSEPTMTMHTKAATDDIYDIFNAPLQAPPQEDDFAENGYETDDYTSGGESTTTRNISASEAGDDERDDEDVVEEHGEDETSDVKSVSEWSDFSTRKHVPKVVGEDDAEGEEHDDSQMSDLIDINGPEPSDGLPDPSGEPEGQQEEEDDIETPVREDYPPMTRTVFIPIPPEDYEPPTRPYRDPFEVANNRLPFMTPITERTETSLDVTPADQAVHAKTPSRRDETRPEIDDEEEDNLDLEALSSPLREVLSGGTPNGKIAQPLLQIIKPLAAKPALAKIIPPKGPIIKDVQCNPVDESIREDILANMQPPLSSYEGFYDHRQEKYEKGGDIRKYAKAISKAGRNSTDKTSNLGSPVVVRFPDSQTCYTIRKELGAGAYAPVYLVENSCPSDRAGQSSEDEKSPVAMMGRGAFASAHHRRNPLEALKMEVPPTPWEFHMMRLSHARLGAHHRATASLSTALEMHLYQDDGFLLLPYHPYGTLLDVVNLFRAEPSGAMDEVLAMFFAVELLRTVEALHAKQLLHGDLKADNCLLRLDDGADQGDEQPLGAAWRADGTGGWAARGVTLIDFGRAIDLRSFRPDVQFIADWKMTAQDCGEMREGRPWTWQIDYHGLAGILHCLLFGKYIETTRADAGTGAVGGGARRYRIRESLKRYWQVDIWTECFDLLLNPGAFAAAEDGGRMPVLRSMRTVRERMEVWLEANCERGVGLRGLMGKVESWARGRR